MSVKKELKYTIVCERCGNRETATDDVTQNDERHVLDVFKNWHEVYRNVPGPRSRRELAILCPDCYDYYSELLDTFFDYPEETEE